MVNDQDSLFAVPLFQRILEGLSKGDLRVFDEEIHQTAP
jgi:hypothetical protein